ncbi:MAG: hypothetical protein HXX13_09070 [Bacteroidetes bacterium]|nr:hypothetical protein [Bacteroidota bacterium]
MKYLISLFILFFLYNLNVSGQRGRLLLVGGGGEKNNQTGWNVPAYRWAVEGKKVAVISVSAGALAPYLVQYCKASYAKEFDVATRDSANTQFIYDSLVSYDVIFFRGGDQWEYYNFYKGTRLQQAVEFVFSRGGTVCGTSAGMHILSSYVFTAEHGSVDSYECIENPNNQYVTLENDFFNFMPGYLFDTHFAERTRFGRLCGFLANLSLNKGLNITGIGMDDLTCMTVDTSNLGTVFGTGCANIYKLTGTASLNGTKLLVDSVSVVQLLQGCTYNFNTGEATFSPLNREIQTAAFSESGNYTVLASGGNALNENLAMLSDFVSATGHINDPILIISGNSSLAESFKIKLTNLGATVLGSVAPTSLNGSDTVVLSKINKASKFLFLGNDASGIMQFMTTSNGTVLSKRIHSDGSMTAFAGDDSRLAGKTIVDNYLAYLNSYYGEMIFSGGLGLLKNTVIMPNTYLNSDIYENTATAVPYALALDTVKFGIWLTSLNYMKYEPSEGKAVLKGYGIDPLMILKNIGTHAGFSTQTATGSSSAPRQIAGMEKLQLCLADDTHPYIMGDVHANGYPVITQTTHFSIVCNRPCSVLNVSLESSAESWWILSADGRILKQGEFSGSSTQIDMSSFKTGIYLMRVLSRNPDRSAVQKFVW